MDFILGFLIGGLIGLSIMLISNSKTNNKVSGTFVIDLRDPTKDICRFEMDESLNSIYSKKQITLNVKVYEDNSLN